MLGAVGAAFSWLRAGAPLLLSLGMAACVEVPGNSVANSARGRAAAAERAERQQLERELAVLRQADGQLEVEIAAAKAAGVRAAAALRAVQTDLAAQSLGLQQAERALAAARERGRQIETELTELRSLEAQLQDQQRLRDEAAARLRQGATEIEAVRGQVAQLETDLLARLTALQQKLVASKQFAESLTGIERSLAAALQALAPSPAPAAPVTPAPVTPPPAAK